jgi:hypothetical protein
MRESRHGGSSDEAMASGCGERNEQRQDIEVGGLLLLLLGDRVQVVR